MEQYSLDKESRIFLGRLIGVNDVNSPILESNESFLKRVELLQPIYYIQNIIEVFLEEKRNFNSTLDYIEYINNEELKVIRYTEDLLESLLDNELINTNKLDKNIYIDKLQDNIDKEKYVNLTFLSIDLDNEIIEALNFMSSGDNRYKSINEYISKITNCRYLEIAGLNLDRLSRYHRNIVKLTMNEIYKTIIDKASKYILSKQLVAVGNSSIIYSIQSKISTEFIMKLHNEFSDNREINIFKLKKCCDKSDIFIREYQNGFRKIINKNDTNIELIDFLSYLNNSKEDKDNLIFEIKGITCQASKRLNFNWNL